MAYLDSGLIENLNLLGLFGKRDGVPDRLVVFAQSEIDDR
jgi:hypothetical protein